MHIVPKSVRVALCLALWLAPAWGATLELLSVSDLISRSSLIVRGQVTGSAASRTGSIIYTHYKINVLKQWKGTAQGSLDVVVPGGTANGARQTFPGAPQLAEGRQYVLFLWTSRRGVISTLGFTQGVFDLVKDGAGNTTASQMPTTETILSRQTGQVVRSQPIIMPLGQLVSLITTGVGK